MADTPKLRGPGSNQHVDKPVQIRHDQTPRGGAAARSGAAAAAATGGVAHRAAPRRIEGRLDGADLRGSDLRNTDWIQEPQLHRADLREAVGTGTHLDGVFTHCDWKGATLDRADVNGIHIGSDFGDADMQGSRLPSNDTGGFDGADLRNADAYQRAFHGCQFGQADLGGATFTLCQFQGADLSGVRNLTLARFRGCTYDDHTTFPDDYDPAARGWQHLPLTDEVVAAIEEMRADAEAGEFSPWKTYGR